jgi:single-strand DNA-binding protein
LLNKIFLQGRLVADPELRHTQSGVAVTSFRIAVDRNYKDRETGERKADFINVVAWRQTGEFVSRFFSKGRIAIVEGELQTRDYTDRDGNRRYATEVMASNVYFGDSRRDGDGGGGYAPQGGGSYAPQSHGGYNAPQGGPPSGGSYNAAPPAVDQFADLTDDDGELPF